MKKLVILFFLLIWVSTSAQKNFYNILDYGAKADGNTLNTKSIQKAIDECHKNGGGTVEFPAGNYLTGTIIMKDNVILNLQPGSKILGSTNIDDYPMYSPSIPNNMDKDVKRALIRGENLKNIGITGFGIIDGQGKSLQINKVNEDELKDIDKVYTDKSRYRPKKRADQRPFLLRFVSCKDVTMQGITLQHPAKWTQHYLHCDRVSIRDVIVFAHGGENNDMVDIDGSKNVVITGLRGDSDDDGICLKSTSDQIVENVLISDCIIRSRTNPIKAGTDSYGGFRNITITNCYIGPSLTNDGYSGRKEGLAGIALELVDGGILENVTISNIAMEEMAAPIFLRLGNRGRTPKPKMKSRPVGILNNINISNIVAKNAGRTGCSIIGEIGHPITNVSISNVRINFDGGGTRDEAADIKPELVNEYPESVSLGILPAYGFFVRHVEGITFRDVSFTYNEEEHRPALLFEDVKNIKLLNFDAEIADDALAEVVLRNTQGMFVNGCSPKKANIFIRAEKNSRNIAITGNNLSKIKKPLYIDETVKMEDIKVSSNLTGKQTLFEFLQPNIERDSLGLVHIYYPGNADVHYTLDGSNPDKNSPKFTKAFEQINPVLIKAVAIKEGELSNTETLKVERAKVLAPHIYPADQFFYKSIEVKLISYTKGADIYYTLDGSVPTISSYKYNGKLVISHTSQLRVKALKKGYTTSDERKAKYVNLKKLKGVHYKYYENNTKLQWESLPNFVMQETEKEGTTDKLSFEGITHREKYFGIVLHQLIKIQQAGEYKFYIGSNDGSKLLIDYKVLVNNDGNHGYSEKSNKIYLQKGEHLIEVRYFQAGGGKELKVFWEGTDFEKQEISTKVLFHK